MANWDGDGGMGLGMVMVTHVAARNMPDRADGVASAVHDLLSKLVSGPCFSPCAIDGLKHQLLTHTHVVSSIEENPNAMIADGTSIPVSPLQTLNATTELSFSASLFATIRPPTIQQMQMQMQMRMRCLPTAALPKRGAIYICQSKPCSVEEL